MVNFKLVRTSLYSDKPFAAAAWKYACQKYTLRIHELVLFTSSLLGLLRLQTQAVAGTKVMNTNQKQAAPEHGTKDIESSERRQYIFKGDQPETVAAANIASLTNSKCPGDPANCSCRRASSSTPHLLCRR